MQKSLPSSPLSKDERLRQYAEIVLAIAEREASLTDTERGGTVSLGSEVEPQHLTNQSHIFS
jgi:hypothetical protein